MAEPFVLARDAATYENLRRSFVEEDPRPTMQELADRFKIPVGTVYRRASQEQWNELRTARMQKLENESEAKALVLEAAGRVDAKVMRAFSDVVIVGLERLTMALSKIPEDQASSTQTQTISTASFAFKNFAEGCKSIGIVGLDRHLEKLGKEDNGRWNPQMLSQINVTVQNLAAQAAKEAPSVSVDVKAVEPTKAETSKPVSEASSE